MAVSEEQFEVLWFAFGKDHFLQLIEGGRKNLDVQDSWMKVLVQVEQVESNSREGA